MCIYIKLCVSKLHPLIPETFSALLAPVASKRWRYIIHFPTAAVHYLFIAYPAGSRLEVGGSHA